MLSKHSLFLIVAIYFIFSYPVLVNTWNLNYSIGWHQRDWITYLIPLWFFLIFLLYRKVSHRGTEISNMFWLHLILSFLPSSFFNHPFLSVGFESGSIEFEFAKFKRAHIIFLCYVIIQIIFCCLLLVKVFRR